LRKAVLLHICCVIDAIPAIYTLRESGYMVWGYFHNSNIMPAEEYERRLHDVYRLAFDWDFPVLVPLYDPVSFLRNTRSLWREPEKGKRCEVCIYANLSATASMAELMGIPFFATTLTASRHKDLDIINRLGREAGSRYGVKYLESAFRKKGGQMLASRVAREKSFYRQNYCGCVYSLRERIMR